ncbi:hypothetical protein TNCV_3335001 [Trichonephila clavipes]|nr:hypothetical protein TNCV_3335001 [Trichonephila clavipes]
MFYVHLSSPCCPTITPLNLSVKLGKTLYKSIDRRNVHQSPLQDRSSVGSDSNSRLYKDNAGHEFAAVTTEQPWPKLIKGR